MNQHDIATSLARELKNMGLASVSTVRSLEGNRPSVILCPLLDGVLSVTVEILAQP